jgi:glyoxylase-like metal-dependent hydrolase (beta-lactamase superfamily II)
MPAAVQILLAGYLGPVPLHCLYRDGGEDSVAHVPSYIYLVRSGGTTILVDSSFSSPVDVWRKRRVQCVRAEREELLSLLTQAEVAAGEVDTLVYTHLHWDHAGNTHLFPRARVVCQKEELEWLRGCPQWDGGYDPAIWVEMARLGDRLTVVEGDASLCPGVELLWLGGHSPGSQAVVARTGAGRVVITGDVANTYENLERGVPCGLVHALREAWDGLGKLAMNGDIFLPSHDWKAYERYGERWIQ